MAKKILKKAQNGAIVSDIPKKTVTKMTSPTGDYKKRIVQTPTDFKVKERRTIKGIISGAPKPKIKSMESPKLLSNKKGGSTGYKKKK
jgi:hypothetical protein